MRLYMSVLGTAAIFFAASAASAGVSFSVSASTDGAGLDALVAGDTVTLDIRIASDGDPAIFGLGASVYGYDTGVASFTGGDAVAAYLFDTCLAPPTNVCFNGLDNVEGGALTAEADGRIQIGNSASLTGRVGTGALDSGLDGVVGGGDAQFRLTFVAEGPGTTTFTIGTGANMGDVIVLADGVTEQATNASQTITVVPEPGTALLMGLGLAGLGLAGRRE